MEEPTINNTDALDLEEEIYVLPKKIIKGKVDSVKGKSKVTKAVEISNDEILDDRYSEKILIDRFNNFKSMYKSDEILIKNGLLIRHQNTPEDITENIVKFIIRNYENDKTCVWCKGVDKKYGLTGDLYSNKYDRVAPIEVKSFTSNGPSQFGPGKKFGVLYFLDLRNWLDNKIILWKVKLNHLSDEFKNIKVNKTQTMREQLLEGRRPHIGWEYIYPQITGFCEKIYDGTFEDIFTSPP